jgi:hypothetical protein
MNGPAIPQAEVSKLIMHRPHVVLLGAGASRAAFPDGDKNGVKLPLVCDLVEMLGLEPIFESSAIDYRGRNFEELYSSLYKDPQHNAMRAEIEQRIQDYFGAMKLPDPPTIYDHLILSLREKDVIATFNWDPFLFQAAARNWRFAKPPRLIFLHGNVAVGYCCADRRKGPAGTCCGKCGRPYESSRLLYPVGQKNYTADSFISSEWTGLQSALSNAFVFTIFGYSAPQSDVEAVDLLKKAWGRAGTRELEQVEMIDIKSEDELRETWDPFIVEHHYDAETSFYDSWIARHPRRSSDAIWRQIMDLEFLTDNPIPRQLPFDEQLVWFKQLVEAEVMTSSETGG